MRIQQRLSAEELACQIIYSYDFILDNFTDEYEQRRGLAKWRLEIFDYVYKAEDNELDYILDYLHKEAPVIYLEISTMKSELTKERNDKSSNLSSDIINLFSNGYENIIRWLDNIRKGNKVEKICIDNSISIGMGSGYDDEYPRTNRSVE